MKKYNFGITIFNDRRMNVLVRRIFAVSIDMVIISLFEIWLLMTVLKYGLNTELGFKYLTLDERMRAYAFFVNVLILFTLQEYFFKTTLGKRIMGLKIVDMEYQNPSFFKILVRNIFRLTDQFLLFGSVTIIFDKRRRRLGELLSKTIVIHRLECLSTEKIFQK